MSKCPPSGAPYLGFAAAKLASMSLSQLRPGQASDLLSAVHFPVEIQPGQKTKVALRLLFPVLNIPEYYI